MNSAINGDTINLNVFHRKGYIGQSCPDSLCSPILTSNDGMRIVLRPVGDTGNQKVEFVNSDGSVDRLLENEISHIANAYKDQVFVFEEMKANPFGFEFGLNYFSMVKMGKDLCLTPLGDGNLTVSRNLNTWCSCDPSDLDYLANMADEFNLDREVSHFPLHINQSLAKSILETLSSPVLGSADAALLHQKVLNAHQNKGEFESKLGYVCRTLNRAFI